ncbi:sigma-54-dependent Fis family transcriptional regulator [Methylovorus glucosotrophus]|uniref:GAF modulated sigma54 specific transcriptional regulator, Fis family n=1 Tax=Methylovorus glucosotrophus (strain SIP3-4) TaxID=582744 RepID=C6X7M4_METGS|nr:sigma-54-dependent Fis family transcriptional regulator [Methylovorus glucosotrophus]ACT49266.1 GAF modulated sigma54 specific transcriptional regulator, Fis family [Methylovorus glucosotrophus SIP3-4]
MQYSIPDEAHQIRNARSQFLVSGQVQQGAVAEEIARSWQRCLANGMDSAGAVDNQILTQYELRQRQEQYHLLLSHARPEMTTLNEQIAHTRSMVILTDDQGVILHSLGDNAFLSEAQQLALNPGSSWHEADRGTNAIGTALIEQSALTVRGAEHFMERNQILSCSAVPIFGAHNNLLGTLDVSNDLMMPQQHTLALVKMAAQMIENRLFRASHQAEMVLHFHARPEFIGTLWEGIAMFGADGRLVALNRSGQFQLGVAPAELPPGGVYFHQLFESDLAKLEAASASTLVFPLRLTNGARLFARAEARNASPSRPAATIEPQKRDAAANLGMLNTGDPQVARAISQVTLVLNQQIPILIEGETGAGKELFARAIHEASARFQGPWVAVNCAALPEGLIEAELFGYEDGAFTGARRKGSTGKLEQANGGTLFLDEIGDMPLGLQARLLRVLQERSVTPLGSSKSKPLDFMLVSATNQKLRERVEKGEFRRDLYYRLNGLSVSLPPLRQRTDLAALVQLILQTENAETTPIDAEVMQLFECHPWPGNIRQLHNVVKTALALSGGGKIQSMHLMQDFLDELEQGVGAPERVQESPQVSLDAVTTEAVRNAWQQHAGNVSAVARQLGISRNTLYRKLKALQLI